MRLAGAFLMDSRTNPAEVLVTIDLYSGEDAQSPLKEEFTKKQIEKQRENGNQVEEDVGSEPRIVKRPVLGCK